MSRIVWAKPNEKLISNGLDRGVLYPTGNPAVAWNGLVSVTEKGTQETEPYYIEGQLFLVIVTPKDYSASISAYTFPDEFGEICGIVEAADGLFLDSQVPDQFALSYRTFYAGTNDYRIHLIYGATAAISDVEHQTLTGDANDPVLFEFDLSAVPQTLAGFRPTAHVMIDSRNVDPHTLANIENKIYGGYGTDAYIPPITTLYEMMNYGNMVIITDNGDDTWNAEGSYKLVELDEESGVFLLDDIEMVNTADGVYALASTDETIPISPYIDGGSPSVTSSDIMDGGTATSAGTEIVDGGPP